MVGEFKQTRSWAVGGRIGYLVTPSLLTYFDGGFTQTRVSDMSFCSISTCAPNTVTIEAQNFNGYFIGGGTEYLVGWFPGLFWKNEYRFADYRANTVPQFNAGVLNGLEERMHLYTHTVRTELVWRFNSGGVGKGPVVAGY